MIYMINLEWGLKVMKMIGWPFYKMRDVDNDGSNINLLCNSNPHKSRRCVSTMSNIRVKRTLDDRILSVHGWTGIHRSNLFALTVGYTESELGLINGKRVIKNIIWVRRKNLKIFHWNFPNILYGFHGLHRLRLLFSRYNINSIILYNNR